MNKSWTEVYDDLCKIGREICDMPNDKATYKKYLLLNGFKYVSYKPEYGSSRPTVDNFSKHHNDGKVYVLSLAHHLVTSVDGNYYDIFDSGSYCVYSWFEK